MDTNLDLKLSKKHCKTVNFNLLHQDYFRTLSDFNWYFDVFQDFLKTKDIDAFKNDSTNIIIAFISEHELNDTFLKKITFPLLNVNNIIEKEKYNEYLETCWFEAHLNDKIDKNTSSKKPKL